MLQALIQDLRLTVRQLSKQPGFTLTAILVLALGHRRKYRDLQPS